MLTGKANDNKTKVIDKRGKQKIETSKEKLGNTVSGPQLRLSAGAFTDQNREPGIQFLEILVILLHK